MLSKYLFQIPIGFLILASNIKILFKFLFKGYSSCLSKYEITVRARDQFMDLIVLRIVIVFIVKFSFEIGALSVAIQSAFTK